MASMNTEVVIEAKPEPITIDLARTAVVVVGEIGARVGEQEVTVKAGSFLFNPRGIPHALWNPTDEPAILLEFIEPSGFEQFFVEVSRIPGGFHPSNRASIDELATKYGHRFHDDAKWLPEVGAKHHLQWG